jgi:simple sugar transport system permease protein
MSLETILTLGTLTAALRLAIPVAVAAHGELVTERAGVLNLGLEGTMLSGALAGYLATQSTGSPWWGLAGGTVVGAACGALLSWLMVIIQANQIVTGLAFTLFAGAATTYVFEQAYALGEAPPRIASLSLAPLLAAAGVVLLVVWFVLERTITGLTVTAVGEDPVSADALGTRVNLVRCAATTAGNALAGLAGALLVCGPLGLFVQNVTAGRGWIALALVVFARWRPVRVVLGALLFGLCDAVRLRLQGTSTSIPYEVFVALPYLVTLLALMVRARDSRTPRALAVPFTRSSS